MHSGDIQCYPAQHFPSPNGGVAGRGTPGLHLGGVQMRRRAKAVSHQFRAACLAGQRLDQCAHIFVTLIHNHRARHLGQKLPKRAQNIVQVAVIVQVIGFNIRDHSNLGIQVQKGVVGFAGFGQENVAVPQSGIATVDRQVPANQSRGMQRSGFQHHRRHTGRRRLAVRSSDRD